VPNAIRLALRVACVVGFIALAVVAMLLIALLGVVSLGAFSAISDPKALGRGSLSGLPLVVGATLALLAPYWLIDTFIETRRGRHRADLEASLPPGTAIEEHRKGGKLIRYARLEDGPEGPGLVSDLRQAGATSTETPNPIEGACVRWIQRAVGPGSSPSWAPCQGGSEQA
jgi:hypothetical protein